MVPSEYKMVLLSFAIVGSIALTLPMLPPIFRVASECQRP
jgi:hypothetical protein